MEKENKRMGVLVGCNYPNTRNELHGCINDALEMRELLLKRFEFDSRNIQLLVDDPVPGLKSIMPTGINIKKALDSMIDEAKPGDVLFFHYSGHGTRIPSLKPTHPFRQDEAIVPCDLNLITDMDFRQLVNRLPEGTSFTIISDSCHSGGLIDKEKEQIGPHCDSTTVKSPYISKSIPFESIIEHLASLTGINTLDFGTHFLELFGAEASLKFKLPKFEIESLIKADEGILLSGCEANETSADMKPGENGGKAYGAFSKSVQMVLKDHLEALSNKEVVLMARKVLETQGINQHPCLYCSDNNANKAFLCQP